MPPPQSDEEKERFPSDEEFLEALSQELATPHLILDREKKKNFALLSGILPDRALDPDSQQEEEPDVPPNRFSEFFDTLIDVTFLHPKTTRADVLFTKLLGIIKDHLELEEDALETLLNEKEICDAIRYGDINRNYPGFTGLALDVFGGYIEFLFLLCLSGPDRAGNERDCKELQSLIERRFGDSHPEVNIPYLQRAHLIFDHIGVAPVYIKGVQKVEDSDYLTLQLVSKCQASLKRLHTTFSILIDDDTTSLPDRGDYRQIKLYGGMKDLRRQSSQSSDSLPIVLDNAKIMAEDVRLN